MDLVELRRRAEEKVAQKGEWSDLFGDASPSPAVLRELRVRAAAFDLCLQEARRELEELRAREKEQTEPCLGEREVRAILDIVPDGIITLDERGAIACINAAGASMFGYAPSELIGVSIHRLLADPAHQRLLAGEAGAFEKPKATFGCRRDGSAIPVELSVGELHTEGERKLVVALRDVTERIRQEQKIRESLTRFQLIAERIEDVFYIVEAPTGRALYVSPAFEKMYGRRRPGLEQWLPAWLEAIHPEDRARVRAAYERACKGDPLDEEYRIRRPDGEIRILRDRAFPSEGATGEILRITGIAQDVTEERRVEEELRHAQKMELVGELVSGIAHDFNNLLMVISGFAKMALSALDPDDRAHKCVLKTEQAAQRGARLTRKLLSFSRKGPGHPEPIEVDELVSSSEEVLRRLVGEHIRVEVHTAAAGRHIFADPADIEQILMNLATNARDAMPDGGRLTVVTEERSLGPEESAGLGLEPGDYLLLEVEDTGCGMDEFTRARAFQPFFTTKDAGRGTGLGLSTVFGIVNELGGHMDVASEPNGGTLFTLHLPLVNERPRAELAEELGEAPRGDGTVLVVEDDPMVARVVERALQSIGYRALAASGPSEALEICEHRAGRIDAVLTDIMMPGRLGDRLATELRARWPRIRVLFMSAHSQEELERLEHLEPGIPLLTKPFSEHSLATALRRELGQAHGESPGRLSAATILLVEDSDAGRMAMREYLEDLGYEVYAASRPSSALAVAEEEPTLDVLLVDYRLPEMPGDDLARRVRQLHPEVQVIVLSGAPEVRLGPGDIFIEKPFDLERLADEVKSRLAHVS